MNEEFKILSISEEKNLEPEELSEYYSNLRKYVERRPLSNTTIGARKVAPRLKKMTAKITILLTKMLTLKNVEWNYDGLENIPDGPVIFAHTHQGLLDNIVWNPTTDKHCVILHSIDASRLLLAAQLNTGLILVKKGDKKNSRNAKLDMIRMLREGHSIAYFPETAWNLSPNKLHLPLHYGFLDTARKAEVPVVPCVHEYSYDFSGKKAVIKKIHTRYGKPIYVKERDDLSSLLKIYEEEISTIRWALLEENGVFCRSSIDNQEYIKFLRVNLKILKLGKIDINNERKHIYGSNKDFYHFYHINDVPYDEGGKLLETQEIINMKKRMLNRAMS